MVEAGTLDTSAAEGTKMLVRNTINNRSAAGALLAFLALAALPAAAYLNLGPAEFVQADGADIAVPGYSVPSFADWNNDGLNDLIVGEGSGTYEAKIRVYLNVGTAQDPQFSAYAYAQSEGADLILPGGG
jgi:hypothetical protein